MSQFVALSGGDSVVLVDQATEDVDAVDHGVPSEHCPRLRVGGADLEAPVGTFTVVVSDMAVEDRFSVAAAEDEQVVRALSSCGPHPALGESVRPSGKSASNLGRPCAPRVLGHREEVDDPAIDFDGKSTYSWVSRTVSTTKKSTKMPADCERKTRPNPAHSGEQARDRLAGGSGERWSSPPGCPVSLTRPGHARTPSQGSPCRGV